VFSASPLNPGHGAELAPYACKPAESRGRRIAQPPAPTRDDFQRDRDRIVHCAAFRRLVYKTQVFLNHEGDLFRTRLTHTLEVAQLARSMARSLGLNEDLVEAIALAHDLGHTAFGHAGQDALDLCMASHGGFEHNLQSLRVVDVLEQPYPAWDGLNLCFETREGILKRCSKAEAAKLEAREPAGVGRRFLEGTQASLEAQLCNLADEIAYNAHDIDDGVRSGLITAAGLMEVPLFGRCAAEVLQDFPDLDRTAPRRHLAETLRRMLSAQVYDVIDQTRQNLTQHAPADADAARRGPLLVTFSPTMRNESAALKRFLFRELYRNPRVVSMTDIGKRIVTELFDAYVAEPGRLPAEFLERAEAPRAAADYIAGMTDRYARKEHERLSGGDLFGST